MELKREVQTAEILDPRRDYQPTPTSVEVRWDPLIGYSSRIVAGASFLPPSDFDLEAFGRQTAENCFFCAPRLEVVTPKFPPALIPEGRLHPGEAALLPHIHAHTPYRPVSPSSPHL